MARYATTTSVPVERSRAEIEGILEKYGADQFLYGWDADYATIAFRMRGRHVKYELPLPRKDDPAFTLTPAQRYRRSREDAYAAWEQACRSRWRALALVVKAKLEAIETGITSFEDEFLSNIMLPSGETAGSWLKPQIQLAYDQGVMPKLLPGPKS